MKLSRPLLWLLTVAWFILGAWWYSNSSCSTCGATATNPNVTAPIVSATSATPPLAATDSAFNVFNADNLRFGKNAGIPVFGTAVSASLDSIAAQAKLPGKKINVTGYYTSGETNSTRFENIGLARADTLKRILVARGVPETNITTNAVVAGDLYFTPTDTLVGGASFLFSNAIKTAEEMLFEPRTVYFNTSQNTLGVSKELADYLAKATKYLQANPNKKLMVTGHTDNVGDAQKNIDLSAARAAFVKTQLAKRGMPAAQIETAGKGMAEPVTDNATPDGRAKNRRVTIALQ
jgi:OmpA-OmpF porin, OOP family